MPRQPVITLAPHKARPLRCGHPWVFSGAIQSVTGDVRALPCVQVKDHSGELIGLGLYSPASQLRVRMLHAAPPDHTGQLDHDLFCYALTRARARRAALNLPNSSTNAYRLVNSEGDGLPGLCIDVYDQLVTFQISTLPMSLAREAIASAIAHTFPDLPNLAIHEVATSPTIAKLEQLEPQQRWWSEHQPRAVEIREHDVRFLIHTEQLQKTGHFADMRPHRRWLQPLVSGRRVLDAYCYTGAFGLYAALANAAHVTCVDSSAIATERVAQNAALNHVQDRVEIITSKVDDYLRSAADRNLHFEVIILDPPKLAPSKNAAPKALKLYESLVIQASRLLTQDGLLCITSCSEAIGITELEQVMARCVERASRRFESVYIGAQGPDHPWPCAMPEGRYASFLACLG